MKLKNDSLEIQEVYKHAYQMSLLAVNNVIFKV